jgi:glycosyltransferase involved in cell wall biosynthesis
MDPLTAIRAVARLRVQGMRVALVLPAVNRPGGAPMPVAARAEAEARALGEWGRGVVQLPRWIPHVERGGLLRGAACAVSCHRPSLEAELSFRTRLLDCVWSGLPAVATRGDELSARAEQEGWARTVPAGDSDALAEALRALLEPAARARAAEAARASAPAYSWDRAAAPLLRLLEARPPARPGSIASLAPELQGADPAEVAQAAARKLVARARRLLKR